MIDWLVREIYRPRLAIGALILSIGFLLYFGLATELGTAQGESADYFANLTQGELDDLRQAAILDFVFMVVYAGFGWLLVAWLCGLAPTRAVHLTGVVAVVLVTTGALCDALENVTLLRILDNPSASNLDDKVELMHDFGASKYTLLFLAIGAGIVLAILASRDRTTA